MMLKYISISSYLYKMLRWMNDPRIYIYKSQHTRNVPNRIKARKFVFFSFYSSLLSSLSLHFFIYTIIQFIYFYNKYINWIYIYTTSLSVGLFFCRNSNPSPDLKFYKLRFFLFFWLLISYIHYVNTHMIPSTHFIILLLLLILIRRFNIDIYLWYINFFRLRHI